MKPLLAKIRSSRLHAEERVAADDNLGRGMDMALTILVFLVLGWGVDRWLGLFPVFTITLVVLASVATFVRMKYTYDATMEQHEAERLAKRRSPVAPSSSISSMSKATTDSELEGAA